MILPYYEYTQTTLITHKRQGSVMRLPFQAISPTAHTNRTCHQQQPLRTVLLTHSNRFLTAPGARSGPLPMHPWPHP